MRLTRRGMVERPGAERMQAHSAARLRGVLRRSSALERGQALSSEHTLVSYVMPSLDALLARLCDTDSFTSSCACSHRAQGRRWLRRLHATAPSGGSRVHACTAVALRQAVGSCFVANSMGAAHTGVHAHPALAALVGAAPPSLLSRTFTSAESTRPGMDWILRTVLSCTVCQGGTQAGSAGSSSRQNRCSRRGCKRPLPRPSASIVAQLLDSPPAILNGLLHAPRSPLRA